nr:tektin 2 [Hymenolepis microstoma]
MEKNIQQLHEYENFNIQSLTLRDRRAGIDYVEDKPDLELRKEKEILQKNIQLTQAQVDKIFEKLLRLKEVRQKLLKDIEDKHLAKDIDLKQYHLTPEESSLKVNPTESPRNIVSIKEWERFSQQNMYLSNKETHESPFLYNESNQLAANIGIEVKEQYKAVNTALRERIHEVDQVINQLNWEKKQTKYNIDITIREIERLEALLVGELPRRKIAETRLENRKNRPGMELCDDLPHRQLISEVELHESTRKSLKDQLEFYRGQLSNLNRALHRIEKDILLKTSTQELDRECLKMREMIPTMEWTKVEVLDPSGSHD